MYPMVVVRCLICAKITVSIKFSINAQLMLKIVPNNLFTISYIDFLNHSAADCWRGSDCYFVGHKLIEFMYFAFIFN